MRPISKLSSLGPESMLSLAVQKQGFIAHKAICKACTNVASAARTDAKAAASGRASVPAVPAAAVCGPELFDAVFVDEGAAVFAHEPRRLASKCPSVAFAV